MKVVRFVGVIVLLVISGIFIGCKDDAPILTGTVSIDGIAQVEQVLTANISDLDGDGTIFYRWMRDRVNIGANDNIYVVRNADIGSTITVSVSRSGYSSNVTSDPTAPVISNEDINGLRFMLLSNGSEYSVSRGTATASYLTIPDTFNGLPVTTIQENGFADYSDLRMVVIPNSVTSIGHGAFRDCNDLHDITIPFVGATLDGQTNTNFGYIFGATTANQGNSIPSSLKTVNITGGTHISNHAFYGCSGLKIITIPNSVTSIGLSAFYDCSGLMDITIPNSVTSIGDHAFNYCSSLMHITIPDSVTSIGDYAFAHSGLRSVTIGDSVTSIGERTFYRCTGLDTLVIGNSVTSIGSMAFSYSDLRSVTIPDSVTSIEGGAFSDCNRLYSVTIGNSVTSIGSGAFQGCSSLRNVTIGDSVTSIGNYAFQGCSSLTYITIPDSVTSIGDSVFQGCSSLTYITIPDSVTSIGYSVFYGSGLTSVTFMGKINIYSYASFPVGLLEKYLAGGIGTYTKSAGSDTWTKL